MDAGTLGSRSGTIRRTGTLGGNNRTSERFGSDIMNNLHNGSRSTLRIRTDGDTPEPPPADAARNNLFDEIRHFDLSKLRRVTPEQPADTKPANSNSGVEPTVAELMRSRLLVMQSDSDSDDSQFDFSDWFVCSHTRSPNPPL